MPHKTNTNINARLDSTSRSVKSNVISNLYEKSKYTYGMDKIKWKQKKNEREKKPRRNIIWKIGNGKLTKVVKKVVSLLLLFFFYSEKKNRRLFFFYDSYGDQNINDCLEPRRTSSTQRVCVFVTHSGLAMCRLLIIILWCLLSFYLQQKQPIQLHRRRRRCLISRNRVTDVSLYSFFFFFSLLSFWYRERAEWCQYMTTVQTWRNHMIWFLSLSFPLFLSFSFSSPNRLK